MRETYKAVEVSAPGALRVGNGEPLSLERVRFGFW